MKYHLFLISLFFMLNFKPTENAQNSKSILIGRIYTKTSNENNRSTLKFTTENQGISESTTEIIGKAYHSSMNFKYSISGKKLIITYDIDSSKEEYLIDDAKKILTSTHLKGYVDGKWQKIYWKRLSE